MASKIKSLKGQLLLDNGKLQGSFFHRTVVLICQHDKEGAFGLVLNRVTDKTLGEALLAEVPERLKGAPLLLGGPVQPQALSYLHTDTYVPDANVMANLNLGHSLETLVELGEAFSPAQMLRVFAGYAGWGAGQLEEEMKRDTWLVHPARVDLVFSSTADLWKEILREKGWKYQLLAEQPDDLSWN